VSTNLYFASPEPELPDPDAFCRLSAPEEREEEEDDEEEEEVDKD